VQILIDYLGVMNWIAVLIASIAGFAVAGIWYAQAVFGKQWAKGAGISKKGAKNANATQIMIGSFMTIFLTTLALAVLSDVLHIRGVFNGMLLGVLVALGFVATTRIMHLIFEQKLPEFIVITVAGDIVTFAAIGGVLALF
jgi:hypothetical protein